MYGGRHHSDSAVAESSSATSGIDLPVQFEWNTWEEDPCVVSRFSESRCNVRLSTPSFAHLSPADYHAELLNTTVDKKDKRLRFRRSQAVN